MTVEPYVMRPHPSPDTWEESSHGLCAAYYGRTVLEASVSRWSTSVCRFELYEGDDPQEGIRQDIVITLAGRIGRGFHRPETDKKLKEVYGLPTHEEERRQHEPTEAERELIAWQSQDEQQLWEPPNDDLAVMELLDRLEAIEPELDRKQELRDREGEAVEILTRYRDHLQLIAETLRDQRILGPGAVNRILEIQLNEED